MLNSFLRLRSTRRPPSVSPTTIGTLSVIGGGQYTNGQTVTLTASRSGGATDIAWSWSVPAGSGVANSNQATLSFTASDLTDGVYTVTATSATSSDSPQTATATITIGVPILAPLTIKGWNLTPADIGLVGAGVSVGELTLYTGPYMIPQGATLDRYLFRGPVSVNNGNITISRSLFEPLGGVGIPLIESMFRDIWRPATLSHTVFNCEFSGQATATQQQRAFLTAWFGPGVFQRNYVHHMGGGIACYNSGTLVDALIENNYIDDVQGYGNWATDGNHSSCLSFRDFTRAVRADRSGIVRRNFFRDTSPNASGSFTIYGQQGITEGLEISENLFAGNNWNVILDANNPHPIRNLTFNDNRFDPAVGSPGPYVSQGATGITLTNNARLNRANADERGAAVP